MRDPAGHWIHDLDPVAVPLWGDLAIHWYGIAYLVGIMLGWWLLERWRRAGRLPLERDRLQDFVLWAGLGMLIGGRLGYCLLYDLDQTLRAPWTILQVWQGGMASHGGMLGFVIAIALYARRAGRSFLVLGDAVAAVAPLGIACGRFANFVNGELWGRPTTVPWAVVFPDAAWHPRELRGVEAWRWQVEHGIANLARHPSQLYAMVLEGLLLAAVLLPLHARHRRPGLTAGLFFALYAVGRIVGECFRMPDAGQPGGPALPGADPIPPILGLLSKGQAFTLPVLLAGLFLIWRAWRRPPAPQAYAPPS